MYIHLVKHFEDHHIVVTPGAKELFHVDVTGIGTRVRHLLEKNCIDVPVMKGVLTVDGISTEPQSHTEERIRYRIELGEKKTEIKYSYTILMAVDEVFVFELGRFAKTFNFRFIRDKCLEYDIIPIGGFSMPKFVHHHALEYDEVNVSELCHPDQGYLIHWYYPGVSQ